VEPRRLIIVRRRREDEFALSRFPLGLFPFLCPTAPPLTASPFKTQEAPNATAWQALFRGSLLPARGLETLVAIKQVSDRSLHSSDLLLSQSRDVFAMATVLSILHALGWAKKHETNVTALFLPAAAQFERPFEPVQAALDAGLEFFQVS
jgi:hypothetical protein